MFVIPRRDRETTVPACVVLPAQAGQTVAQDPRPSPAPCVPAHALSWDENHVAHGTVKSEAVDTRGTRCGAAGARRPAQPTDPAPVQHTEWPAGQIAAAFTLTQQAISQHIGVLEQAGLLAERREGTRRLYTLRHESLEPARAARRILARALSRLKKAVETAHPRPPTR